MRRFLFLACVAALLVGLLAQTASAATRLGIGDSVMLGARSELRARGIPIDAVVSRQFSTLPGLIRARKAAGHLPGKLIIHLGNNGYVDPSDCDAAIRAAGSSRHVYLVTLKVPRGWRATNNSRLRACANRHRNASIIDWFGYSVNHPSWFAHDLYHLTGTGARKYAAFVGSHTS